MRTGKDRVRVEETGAPVTVGAVRVEPGDMLLGDADGLVAIAAAQADDVLAVAAEIEQAETAIREAIAAGASLRDARAAVGYHAISGARIAESNRDPGRMSFRRAPPWACMPCVILPRAVQRELGG